jgi:hypothetical protein
MLVDAAANILLVDARGARPNSIPVSPRLSLRPQKPFVRVCLFQMPQWAPSPTACSPAPRQIPVKARNAAMHAGILFLLIFNCSWYLNNAYRGAHKNKEFVLLRQENI